MKPYKEIFFKIEDTLKKQSIFSEKNFDLSFAKFKEFENRSLTDNDYYNIAVEVVFYSGIKANIVDQKMRTIKKYFGNYNDVCKYKEEKIKEISNDQNMIKNEKKIRACYTNALVFNKIIKEYGSFKKYVDSFNPNDSFENLLLFKEEIQYRFAFFGDITSYHFMTDIGLPVLKPDRVIKRIFERVELIEDRNQILKTVIQGQKISEKTDYPIRYIDIILVKYGQLGKDEKYGLNDGICLEKAPKCSICGISEYCKYYQTQ